MTVTGDELRRTMAQFATGVTVILVRDQEAAEEPILGMTANAVTSVSLNPPQILICVAKRRTIHEPLTKSGQFSVSILSQEQEAVSQYFAGQREPELEKAVSYKDLPNGLPGIDGALGWLEAKVTEVHPGGDHDIFVAEVTSAITAEGVAADKGEAYPADASAPLLFYNSSYRRLAGV